MLQLWHNRAMFGRFSENAKSLLLVTLSGAMRGYKAVQEGCGLPIEEEEGGASSLETLAQSMVTFPQDPALANYNTLHSGSSVKPVTGHARKKKARKKVHIMTDSIPDENKTAELKSLEAFFVSHQQQIEDLELYGGEDPVILHYVINNLPSIVAHKEVFKFKRRPQYLEMLVHLLNLTLAKGHYDRVMEWLTEGFQWIAKRNEILLNPKVVQRIIGEQFIFGKVMGRGNTVKTSRLVSSMPSKVELKKYAQRAANSAVPGQRDNGGKEQGKGGAKQPPPRDYSGTSKASKHTREQSGTTNKSSMPQSGGTEHSKGKGAASLPRALAGAVGRRDSPHVTSALQHAIRKSLVPHLAAELSKQVRITKEDLEAKSAYVLINKLPEVWKIHKCR